MQLIWKIPSSDVERLRKFVADRKGDPFVVAREKRNLARHKPPLSATGFWRALVGCLLTTQQKSGPDGAVARFMRVKPFPLGYTRCRSEANLASFATRILSGFGGIRRSTTIGGQLSANLRSLENGLWSGLLDRLNALRTDSTPSDELSAAEYLAEHLAGLGPKQSRNLLQAVGLTRYELPIDSRLTKWLNEFGFPVRLSAAALSDPNYYSFVSLGIQQMCEKAGIYPCVLDAAIFASFDRGGWRAENLENWGEGEGA